VVKRERTREHMAWVSFWSNFGLAVFKITIGLFGYSRLLFIDGTHSAANSIMAIIMLAGLRTSEIPADKLHKYGHGKGEFIFSSLAGLIVMVIGLVLLVISVVNIRGIHIGSASIMGMSVAFTSLVANLLLYHYLRNRGEQLNSRVLVNNAANNYLNAITSAIVLVGITAAIFRFFHLEQVVVVVISLIILYSGIRKFREGINGIMDRTSFYQTPSRLYEIKRLVTSMKDIKSIEDVKIKRIGDKDLVNLEIMLDKNINLARADDIGEKIKRKIFKNLNYVENVLINFKPANG